MKRALLFFVCCWPFIAIAETVWVNDIIYLGIRPEREGGKPVAVVKSGTVLEVLEREKRNIRVRTPEGVEGWVSVTYISEEMPARQQLAEMEERYAKISSEMERVNEEMAKVNEANTALSANLMNLTTERDQLQQKIAELTQDIEALRPKPTEAKEEQMEMYYWVSGIGGLFIVAFLSGASWYRSRAMKRLGGLRI